MQGIVGRFYKLTEYMKTGNKFLKKIRGRARSDLAGQWRAGPAQIQEGGVGGGV
jgi:hypothetical protein